MSNVLKEPAWAPAEIPGLVRKKGRKPEPTIAKPANQPAQVVAPESQPPVPPVLAQPEARSPEPPSPPAKEELNGTYRTEALPFDPAKAHEDLMGCLVDARTLVQKIQASADSYYIMCDYLAADDAQQYIPIVDSLMRALQTKDPQLVPELIEGQAQQIVEGWLIMAEVAAKAVKICEQLAQTSRAAVIDDELRKEWNGQATGCATGQ